VERYLMISGGILASAAFVPAIFFLLRGMYHFIAMPGHYRSGRHQFAANFVAFLVPFAPRFFTEQGNFHRKLFLPSLFWSLCSALCIEVMYAVLGIGNP
jgi:hypothetical protein